MALGATLQSSALSHLVKIAWPNGVNSKATIAYLDLVSRETVITIRNSDDDLHQHKKDCPQHPVVSKVV
jgi:hypothetical protein